MAAMPRPFAPVPAPPPHFPVGGPVPAADLVGREGYLRRLVERLEDGQHVLAAGRLGPRMFDVMRAHFQAQRGVAYAFLGSEQGILEELFSAKGHAFYRFAVPLDLSDAGGHRFGIDPDDWLEYLRGKFAEKKLAIDEASVDRLLDATGGHPQDTMQVCAALYYLMRDTGARTVTADLLGVAYEQAMRELERPFALHWGEL